RCVLRPAIRRVGELIRYLAPSRGRAIVAVLGLLASTATTIAGPVIARQAIDPGIVPGDRGQIELWGAGFGAVAVAGLGFGALQSYLTSWVGERVLTDLRVD